jgi:hypothetical protein
VIGPVNPAATLPHFPSLPVIRLFHSVVLLTLVGLTSCAGPKAALSKGAAPAAKGTGPKPALVEGTPPAAMGATLPAVGTPPAAETAPPSDPKAESDASWNLAMKRYVPPATGLQPAAIELAEPGTTATPAPTVSTTSSVSQPAIAAPAHDLNPADIPFATWAPGKRGIVKSPYDPHGRLIDVRDFNAGQLSQCPYTGKIFRVPPLK